MSASERIMLQGLGSLGSKNVGPCHALAFNVQGQDMDTRRRRCDFFRQAYRIGPGHRVGYLMAADTDVVQGVVAKRPQLTHRRGTAVPAYQRLDKAVAKKACDPGGLEDARYVSKFLFLRKYRHAKSVRP